MTSQRPPIPTDSYEAHPDRAERILFFLTVGALLVGALIGVLVSLFWHG